MRRGPHGRVGYPIAKIPTSLANGVPVPMLGVSVPQQAFGLSQVIAYEEATGISANVMMWYQGLSQAWPSAYAGIVASGRKPMITLSPRTAVVGISGGVRNSDGGVDSPMIAGSTYKGIVVSALTEFSATQPSGSYMAIGGDQVGPNVTTSTAITSSSVGSQIMTSTFTPTASYSTANVYDLAGLTSGTYDSLIHSVADNAGGHAIIRFAHEMNASWYCWGFGSGSVGFTAANYISMWNHVRAAWRGRESSGSYSPWVWSPNISGGGANPFSAGYPGDSACEFVALDGYSYALVSYPSFSSVFDADLATLSSLSSNPQIIGETGVSATDPARAAWFIGLFSYMKAHSNLKGFSYFDHADSAADFLDSDAAACAAYRTGALSLL